MKLYFVGIGGIGTSALAQLCATRGDDVSGSNLGKTAIWPQLEDAGITLFTDHSSAYFPEDTELLIYSEAIPEDNPERLRAKELGIPERSYFQFLGTISKEHTTVAVAGTHGKTTTSAMLAAGFLHAKFDATMVVGSKLKEFDGSNFKAGTNGWLIAEACEYRNNFRFLSPDIVIVTNVELDHVDYYESEEQYRDTFVRFCQKAKTVIYHKGDKAVETILDGFEGEKLAIDASTLSIPLDLPGLHNRQNAALALACGEEMTEMNIKKFKKGLMHYQGAWRRLEQIGGNIYDDYGHHPTEIKATLQALREKHPDGKISLIFEPHQYSRTKQFFDEFLESFKSADSVALYPIYAARDTEEDKKSISRQDFIDKNSDIKLVNDLESAQVFASQLEKSDVLIFMGAGNISLLAHEFVNNK